MRGRHMAHGLLWEAYGKKVKRLDPEGLTIDQQDDNLIKTLKKRYDKWCANSRGGGGGFSSRRPSFLYICIHRLA